MCCLGFAERKERRNKHYLTDDNYQLNILHRHEDHTVYWLDQVAYNCSWKTDAKFINFYIYFLSIFLASLSALPPLTTVSMNLLIPWCLSLPPIPSSHPKLRFSGTPLHLQADYSGLSTASPWCEMSGELNKGVVNIDSWKTADTRRLHSALPRPDIQTTIISVNHHNIAAMFSPVHLSTQMWQHRM